MSNVKFKIKKTQQAIGLGLIALLAGLSTAAFAGGFQLFEENVTNMGNAYAGAGAEASDASTEFYNPAGMTLLDNPQFVLAGTYLDVNINSHVVSATDTETMTTNSIFFKSTNTITNTRFDNQSIDAGSRAVIPAFHFVYPICHKVAFGFGATAPFGLETKYPTDSLPAFLATTSAIQTVNIGPSVAVQITRAFSVGAGVDSQYLSATLDEEIPFNPGVTLPSNIPPLFGNTTHDLGSLINEGDSWGWGWHAGILYQFTPDTRVGLAYHSPVKHDVTGRALVKAITPDLSVAALGISVPPIQVNTFGNFSSAITLPGYADLSIFHAFNPQWAVLGSVDYTHWSSINNNTATYSPDISDLVQSATYVFNLQDTWRLAAGVDYKPAPQWTLRTGVAYDESPVRNSTTRTFRLPDSDRYWASVGAQYVINREFTVDVGYAHLFVQHSIINNTQVVNGTIPKPLPLIGGAPFTLAESAVGDFDSSVNEVGVQLTWNII